MNEATMCPLYPPALRAHNNTVSITTHDSGFMHSFTQLNPTNQKHPSSSLFPKPLFGIMQLWTLEEENLGMLFLRCVLSTWSISWSSWPLTMTLAPLGLTPGPQGELMWYGSSWIPSERVGLASPSQAQIRIVFAQRRHWKKLFLFHA